MYGWMYSRPNSWVSVFDSGSAGVANLQNHKPVAVHGLKNRWWCIGKKWVRNLSFTWHGAVRERLAIMQCRGGVLFSLSGKISLRCESFLTALQMMRNHRILTGSTHLRPPRAADQKHRIDNTRLLINFIEKTSSFQLMNKYFQWYFQMVGPWDRY